MRQREIFDLSKEPAVITNDMVRTTSAVIVCLPVA